MVCDNSGKRLPDDYADRVAYLKLSPERAAFLTACAHTDYRNHSTGFGVTVMIPYDPIVQLREAARLGINAKDTALMMGPEWTTARVELEAIANYIEFPILTTHPSAAGQKTLSLFTYEPHQGGWEVFFNRGNTL